MSRQLRFSGVFARVQYALLMALFPFAITRGLYGSFARGLGRLFPAGTAVWLHEGGAPPFRIALDDGYWTRFALWHAPYEPEVAAVLNAAAGATPLFCDLGANKGYWTTRAAPLFGRVIGVEASGATFAELQINAGHLANVTLHHAAIHARSGNTLDFVNTPFSHASARLTGEYAACMQGDIETVTTLAIDDLVPAGTAALIKLDVEGAEQAAIAGAARALREGSVLIYEDHGNDPDCTVSAQLLAMPDMWLYSCEKHLEPVPDLASIRAFKRDPFKGYNFVAARADSSLLAEIAARFANPPCSG